MEILDIVLPVFLVISLGAVLRARGFLTDGTRAALSRLVFYVAAPSLLLSSIARTPLAESLNPVVLGTVIGVSVVAAFVGYLLAVRATPARRGVIASGCHRSNMVFMGVPILTYAYGEAVLGSVAVLIGIMVVVYNFLAVVLLSLPHRGATDGGAASGDVELWRGTTRQLVRNPLIIGCGAGLVLAAIGAPIPLALDRALTLVGRTALPLALIAVGADLDFHHLRGDILATTIVSVAKLILYPALLLAALLALGLEGTTVAAPVILLASPTAVVSYIMAKEMRGDHRLAGSIVIGTTTVSLLTTTGWLLVLRGM